MHLPKVSVVIPTYNRAFCVGEAIQSALEQTHAICEVIVVDDGSTDNTREALEKFGDQIRVIPQQNAGVSGARNAGILAAKGEWVAFLDSDDEWYPDALENLFAPFPNDPQIKARFGNVRFIEGKLYHDLLGLRDWKHKEPVVLVQPLLSALSINFFPSGSAIWRETLLRAGLFDTSLSLHEDTDLFARTALLGAFMITPHVVAKIKRKGPRCEGLTSAHSIDPELTPRNLAFIYRRLLVSDGIKTEETKHVRRQLGGSLHDLAEARYKKTGHIARVLLWRAMIEGKTLRGIIRSGPALLFGAIGFKWAEMIRRARGKRGQEFRRSELYWSGNKK